jgi:hypothetical protein
MVIPQISLPIAFGIGLSLGVLGFVLQEVLGRRRTRRRLAAGDAQGTWGGGTTATTTEVKRAPEPPAPLDSVAAAPPMPGPTASAAGLEPARARAEAPRKGPGRAEKPAPEGQITPIDTAWIAGRRQQAANERSLRKREAALDEALDALVSFVEGQPRRARAKSCAATLDRVLPKAGRSAELRAFLKDAAADASPSALQAAAEEIGLQLAGQLKAAKTELAELGG